MLALESKFPSNPNFKTTRQMFSKKLDVVIGNSDHHVFYADRQSHFFYWEGAKNVPNLYLFDDKNVTVIINKGNGLLDFSMVESEEKYKVEVEEDAVFIIKGNVRAVLPQNYENVTITPDRKEYYKLLQNGTLEREYCSHSLKIDGRFSVNVTDLLNYNCFKFDSDKVLFLKLNNDLQLLSDKGALSILDYYKSLNTNNLLDIVEGRKFADNLDLSIELSNRIIEPEEFRKRADNSSVFKYYQPDGEGLEIYHNQPDNKRQIGLIDLKNKSILDCSVEIIDGDLILSSEGKAIAKVKNWNIYQPAREMIFAFSDAAIYNEKCIVSSCDSRDIIKEFEKKGAKPVIRGDTSINKLTLTLRDNKGARNEENKQRYRRHHIRHGNRHMGHRNYHSPIQEVASSAVRSSSWVNVFVNTVEVLLKVFLSLSLPLSSQL